MHMCLPIQAGPLEGPFVLPPFPEMPDRYSCCLTLQFGQLNVSFWFCVTEAHFLATFLPLAPL